MTRNRFQQTEWAWTGRFFWQNHATKYYHLDTRTVEEIDANIYLEHVSAIPPELVLAQIQSVETTMRSLAESIKSAAPAFPSGKKGMPKVNLQSSKRLI